MDITNSKSGSASLNSSREYYETDIDAVSCDDVFPAEEADEGPRRRQPRKNSYQMVRMFDDDNVNETKDEIVRVPLLSAGGLQNGQAGNKIPVSSLKKHHRKPSKSVKIFLDDVEDDCATTSDKLDTSRESKASDRTMDSVTIDGRDSERGDNSVTTPVLEDTRQGTIVPLGEKAETVERRSLLGEQSFNEDVVFHTLPPNFTFNIPRETWLAMLRNSYRRGMRKSPKDAAPKKEMSKAELLKQYRLHFFVGLIFFITVMSVSLSWHFRNLALQELHSSQAIFFNPRTREITLTGPSRAVTVAGSLGQGIPGWHLPLHCPIVIGDSTHSKECTWRNTAVLRIADFGDADVHCYNVSWESLSPSHVPYDCYEIGDDLWYGPTNQSRSTVPIQGEFEFNPEVYSLGNNGIFSSVVDFYWLSFRGSAIYASGENPLRVSWNLEGSNKICLISNYSGSLYSKVHNKHLVHLNYTICSGLNIKKTHAFMQSMIAPLKPESPPPSSLFQGPHWSVEQIYQSEAVSQQQVLDLVGNLTSAGFQHNTITLDGNWQGIYGDLVFEGSRFPNMTELTDAVVSSNSHLTLAVNPYFHYKSHNFHNGVVNAMFVKDAGGRVTGLTDFKGGLSAAIDVFSQNGMEWYEKQLETVLSLSAATSVRLTYGNESWLPFKPHFKSGTATPNTYRRVMTEKVRNLSSALIVEHTSDTRHVASLIPVVTDVVVANNKLCFQNVIETALTLGLMGYPFIMADGYRLSPQAAELDGVRDGLLPEKFYIRWLQLATFFPAYQMSVAPWQYDDEVTNQARNLTILHKSLVLPEVLSAAMLSEIKQGLPILRPVWWLNPTNHSLHESQLVKTEFLIGDRLLVAPVLCAEDTTRDIFFPHGVWEDLRRTTVILGPSTVTKYPVPLGEVAVFKRKTVVGENDEL